MAAENHNPFQNKVSTNNLSGNAVDCTSIVNSSQYWRRLGWFFAVTVLAGFVLNEIWEMTQMSFYAQTAGHSWRRTFGLCTGAALGDVEKKRMNTSEMMDGQKMMK